MITTASILFFDYTHNSSGSQELAWVLHDYRQMEIDRGFYHIKSTRYPSSSSEAYYDFYVFEQWHKLNGLYLPCLVSFLPLLELPDELSKKNSSIKYIDLKSLAYKKRQVSANTLRELFQIITGLSFPSSSNALVRAESIKKLYYHLLEDPKPTTLQERIKRWVEPVNAGFHKSSNQPHQAKSFNQPAKYLSPKPTPPQGCLADIAEIFSGLLHMVTWMASMLLVALLLGSILSALVDWLVQTFNLN